MMIELPAGYSRVRVRFSRTADRTVGGLLSGAAVIVLAGLGWIGRRQGGASELHN